jgi:hypothetical protein
MRWTLNERPKHTLIRRLAGLAALALIASGCGEERPEVDSDLQKKAVSVLQQYEGGHTTYDTPPFTIEMAWFEHGGTDDDLQEILRGAPQVRVLKMRHSEVTDLGLELLVEKAPYLEHMEISGMPLVTDVGLKFLEDHPRLRYLSLVDVGATEEAARALEDKLGLESLIFKVTDSTSVEAHEFPGASTSTDPPADEADATPAVEPSVEAPIDIKERGNEAS